MKNKLKKITLKSVVSVLLSFLMVVTSVSWNGIVLSNKQVKAEATAKKVEETKTVIDSESTKDSTTFQLSNGKKKTVFYGNEVRFEDEDGNLVDYDPSLVPITDKKSESGMDLSQYQYENKEGDKKQYLPKKLTEETPVLMENGDYTISFAPITGEKTEETTEETTKDVASVASVEETTLEANAFSSIQKLTRGAVETEKVLTAEDEKEELPVKVSYESEDKECNFEYQSLDTGVKESITLKEAPKTNQLKFKFYAKGLKAKKNVFDGGITFYDEKSEDIIASLEAPNMNDATKEAYSEKLSYEIEESQEKDTYIVTLTLDEEYLKDKDRKYPITIDPTVNWKGSSDFWDVYVINGKYKDTNFYDSGITVMMAGDAKQGVYRTYLRFKDFTKKIDNKYVESATLTMYETGNSQSGQTIEARRVKETWSRSGLKWSNRPGYSTTYGTVKTTGTNHKARSINVTNYARECANGSITSYGLMLRNANEEKSYGQFYSSRYSNASYRPKMSVTYYDGPTTATSVTSSTDYIKSNGSTTISWAGITSKSLKQVQYRIAKMNSDKSAETSVIKDYTSTGKNTASGSFTLNASSLGLSDGIYRISIRGLDNGGIKGSRKSRYIYVDSVAPKINSLTLDGGNGTGISEDSPSSSVAPTLKWNLTESYLSKVEYQVGNGSFINAGNATVGQINISTNAFTDSGTYTINVRITDRSGNVTSKSLKYYYIDQSKATDYKPTNVEAKQTYGKSVVSWNQPDGALPGSIYYEVHRGNSENFTPSAETLVQSALKTTYLADTKTGDGKTYYYKVRAVKLAKTGKVIETSEVVTTKGIKQQAKSEYEQFLGSKEYRDTVEIATPNGSGSIDKASGNLLYTADDFDISVGAMGLSLTRSYNSQTDKTGMFGHGWNDSFQKQLYQVGTTLVFQDSDGTYVTFEKQSDGSYGSKETKDYTVTLGENKTDSYAVKASESLTREAVSNEDSDRALSSAVIREDTYTPSHNVTVEMEDGETQVEEEKVTKTIPVACTLTDKDNMVYKFDSNGYVTAIEDSNGNYVLYEYDRQGRLHEVTTNKNQSLQMIYGDGDESNYIKEIKLPDDSKMEYSYTNGNLTKVTHSKGSESVSYTYGYNSENWLTSIKDAKGNDYQVSYTNQKVTKFTNPIGEYQKVTYGDGTTTVSQHKSDGTTLAEDSITYQKSTGKILSATDVNGVTTTYSYGDSSNALLQTGTETKVTYQTLTDNQVTTHEDVKVTTSTTYDANENVKIEVDETGTTTKTEYGSGIEENLPKSEVTTNGDGDTTSKVSYTYDDNGNVLEEKDSVAETETDYDYDEDNNWELKEETEFEEGEIVSNEVIENQENNLQITEDSTVNQGAVKESSTTVYDTMGREIESINQDTKEKTNTTYDFLGRVVKTNVTKDDITKTTTKAYDANGAVTSEKSSTGVTTTYAYDTLNRVTKAVETADGKTKTTTTAYGYEDVTIQTLSGTQSYTNLTTQTTTVNGKETEKTYTDAKGNAVRTLSGGIYTDHVFTKDGKEIATITLGNNTSGDQKIVISLFDKEGKQTHTIQNPKVSGGTITVTDDSIVTESKYDTNGNEIEKVDGNGNIVTYTYDDQNRVTGVSEGGTSTTIAYATSDGGDSTTTITDDNGNKNIEVTDAAGLTKTTTDAGSDDTSLSTNYTYNDCGNKTQETYQDGGYKTFDYDGKNRLIKTESYEAPEPSETLGEKTLKTTYSYDSNDQLLESVDYHISGNTETAYRYTEYTYDSRGQMTSYAELSQESAPTADEVAAKKIRYTYDSEGKLETVTYPTTKDGVQGLSYTYDSNNWLSKITASVKSGSTTKEITLRDYTYDSYGKVKEIKDYRNVLGDGDKAIKKTYTYDTFDRVTKMVYVDFADIDRVMESYTYRYDKNFNITSKTEINNYPSKDADKVNETKSYTYDSLGRLTKSVTTNHLDADSKKTNTYTYDGVGNRLSEDENGTKITYTYNGLDQVKTATVEKGTAVDEVKTYNYDLNGNEKSLVSTKTGEFLTRTYDAENRLKTVSSKTGDNTTLIQTNDYNGDGQRIQKVEGDTTTNYYYQDGTVSYTTDGSGEQISQNLIALDEQIIGTQKYTDDSAEYYTYNKDIQGSTTSLVKADGNVDVTYQYTDFGETSINGDNKSGNEVCYTGGIFDSSTGLYYLNARYYNPEDGRFLTEDTYRGETNEPDTQHLYAYCANNPINYVDPSGHLWIGFSSINNLAKLGNKKAKKL